MNYDEMVKEGRITALKEFFKLYDKELPDYFAEWFYENFLGICKNFGYLWAEGENLLHSPYAKFALHIYNLGL